MGAVIAQIDDAREPAPARHAVPSNLVVRFAFCLDALD
jgi:hypothetical protein